jgi:hypothetical protein
VYQCAHRSALAAAAAFVRAAALGWGGFRLRPPALGLPFVWAVPLRLVSIVPAVVAAPFASLIVLSSRWSRAHLERSTLAGTPTGTKEIRAIQDS